MGVKTIVKKIGGKASDKVAKLATLSPNQVMEVQAKREEYLLEMPNPNDELAVERTSRMMAASSIEIFNAYLPQIKELYLPINHDAEYDTDFLPGNNIKYINITKWVNDRNENSLEKLVNVYAVLSNEFCNIALVFNRTQKGTNVYLAVVNTLNANNNTDAERYKNRIIEAIRGNFPGAEWGSEGSGELPCFSKDKKYSVATASNIPTEKSEKFVSQTIEKLLDGIVPDSKKKEYTIVLLATPIHDVEERKMRLGEFYSGMVPYAQWQTQFTYAENGTVGSSATVGVNVGASAGVQNGTNSSITDSEGISDQTSQTDTQSSSDTTTEGESIANTESTAHAEGANEMETVQDGTNESSAQTHQEGTGTNYADTTTNSDSLGGSAGAKAGPAEVSANYNHTWGKAVTEGTSTNVSDGTTLTQGTSHSIARAAGKTAMDTLTKGMTNTISKSVAKTTGVAVANTVGRAVTKAMATTAGASKAVNFGANFGANFARSSTVTAMIGKNESISQTFANYNVKHALEMLETQMKRLEQSTALGMWDFAAYVMSEDQDIANNVAHSYLALTLGEESYMSKSAINVWRGNIEEEAEQAKEICDYLRCLRHPIFALNPEVTSAFKVTEYEDGTIEEEEINTTYNVYPSVVTATTSLSGKELAYSLNFPQKSVAGLPVLESAEFGRNIVTYDDINEGGDVIQLGSIYHMRQVENTKVDLSIKSLASHTFITGSTGSGKSNTIYQMLIKARKQGVKFLVVEPAKGEYKNIFGSMKDVSVYGTNPIVSPLLRINPFSFPRNIHVLEHMDRLAEIFNVCWPMYAAMPAVLKSAVEKSYSDCGWDLVKSVNTYGEDIYPSFADVADNVKTIIDTSEYDNDNKGAYKGSLLTRLQSLSNGINGMIFVSDELSNAQLYDENVIVDLSRVGSSETKSLIMGMMVLKLQEYRMATAEDMNVDLHHITVLEEAHNLLRRASAQGTEGNNLLGKSVEMIANAIAEMRTYGEGFIIADQAPGLMDMSVIRNTNTKIIMRLPDEGDRELVGKSANLNDDQIMEVAKLPCGVAAVYQNEWVQPVLCKIDKAIVPEKRYKYIPGDEDYPTREDGNLPETLLSFLMEKELLHKNGKADLKRLKHQIVRSKLSSTVKKDFVSYISNDTDTAIADLRILLYDFLSAQDAIIASRHCNDITEWVRNVVDNLNPSLKGYSKQQIDLVMALILYEQSERDVTYRDVFCRFTELYKENGGVL